jgi:hypothetical protein
MKVVTLRRLVGIVAMALAATFATAAQAQAQNRVEGLIHDFAAPPDNPWEILAEWALSINSSTGRIELIASINMVRSDSEPRQSHTHHVGMSDGIPVPIAGGYRIVGTASITTNGVTAAFSPSPVVIDLTGGSAQRFSNIQLTFGGAAASHFGSEPLDGVVRVVVP